MSELASTGFDPPAIDAGAEFLRRERCVVLGVPVDVVGWSEAVDRIAAWAKMRQKRLVILCNVHSVITAKDDREFAATLDRADMVAPDGMPLAWRLRGSGFPSQPRIDGPGLMLACCARAEADGTPIFLLGSTQRTLALLQANLLTDYPRLQIAGALSPPFDQDLAQALEPRIVETIRESGAGILFVSLGCPKQEHWMARHTESLNLVMIGVGAAFDFHAGTVRRAPEWMRKCSLEWLHRLAQDPRRLWRRYLMTNSRFIYELIQENRRRRRAARGIVSTPQRGK